jgi:DNA-binding MarR family transcriptional regulator
MGQPSTKSKTSASIAPTNDDAYQLMLLLRTAYFSLRRKCNTVCQQSDCNGDQFVVLGILFEQTEGSTQQFLSDESGYDPVTIGTMLKTMHRNGLVEREPHPSDGRAKLVRITSTGKQTFRKLWRDSQALRDAFASSMSSNQQKTVTKILASIADAMDGLEV